MSRAEWLHLLVATPGLLALVLIILTYRKVNEISEIWSAPIGEPHDEED